LLYARTARHLRWEQWIYRPVRRIQSRMPYRAPAITCGPSRCRRPALAETAAGWGPGDPGARMAPAGGAVAGAVRFLHPTGTLNPIDWNRRHVDHLWSYNLHYFDYALDLAWAARLTGERQYADRFVDLASSWIAECAPGRGDGWEPYPISLRIVNWIYSLLLLR